MSKTSLIIARFKSVIVVDATSKRQLELDLQRAIRVVGPEYAKATWEDAVTYLDGKERGWLLFLDNADSPELDLHPYLPSSIHGAILITTRNQMCREYAPDDSIHVGGLTEREAINLLHRIANVTPVSDVASLEIVRELGTLALAVTQAGAYIRKTRQLSSYLATLRSHRDRLLRKIPHDSTNYAYSTYAALDLSFRQLPSEVKKLLQICAYFHHLGIPMALFERSSVAGFATRTVLKSCPPPESDNEVISNLKAILRPVWDEVAFQDMIDAAQHASFIDTITDDAGNVFYSVHPLLQRYIVDSLGEGEDTYARMAAQMLLGATHHSKESNSWYWKLVPHIDALPQSVKQSDIAHAIAFHEIYKSLGDWKASKRLLEFALSKLLDTYGRLHEDSITVMGQLAWAMQECGQLEEAERLEREVLDIRIELLGRRHPKTVTSMNNLAVTLYSRGEMAEAERLNRQVLDIRIELFGRRHPDTVDAMGNLAATIHARGELEEAERLKREVLDIRIEFLGRRHPDTVNAMGNLAAMLQSRGELEEAERLKREVLDMRIELLGRRHPNTVDAMGNLVATLHARGELEEAERLKREVLNMRIELLGRRHPNTLLAMANLAVTLYAHGQLEAAEEVEREVLDTRIELLGRRHPSTVLATQNLAATLRARGQLDEAEKLEQGVRRDMHDQLP